MKRNSGQDALPWLVWLALAVDPMTAAVVLTTRPRPIDTRAGHDAVDATGLAPNTIQLTTD
jgi:hypothetical protein